MNLIQYLNVNFPSMMFPSRCSIIIANLIFLLNRRKKLGIVFFSFSFFTTMAYMIYHSISRVYVQTCSRMNTFSTFVFASRLTECLWMDKSWTQRVYIPWTYLMANLHRQICSFHTVFRKIWLNKRLVPSPSGKYWIRHCSPNVSTVLINKPSHNHCYLRERSSNTLFILPLDLSVNVTKP